LPEIKIHNVTKRYGRIVANDCISLTIKDGEYISVIGPSGCGKTTLIKNIAGIITPDEGEIYIDGRLVNDLPIEDREIGYVFQNIALFPHLTIWDNIVYGPKIKGLPQEEVRPLAIEMLDMIKISASPDAYPSELSSGTQQKTAVARALMSNAKLLLLDEPLGALDVKVRTELRYELRKLVKDLKLTALHVTHDQEEAMSISDRVIVMRRGKIIEHGPPINLFTRPQNIFTANFVGETNFLTGTIKDKRKNGSIIEIGDNIQLLTKREDVKTGDLIVTAFRPEFVSINEKEKMNTIPGIVENILYSGSMMRIMVKLPNGKVITLKKPINHKGPIINLKEKIQVHISPEKIFIYKYPETGLLKELTLE